MAPLKTLKYKGYTIELHVDQDAQNPREDFDHAGTMICSRNSGLGDKNTIGSPDEVLEHIKATKAVWLPVYMYDHSGRTIRTTPFSCPWDSGQVGVIFMEREKVLQEFNAKALTKQVRAKAEELLRAEVKEYDQFLTGEVYGYIVKKDETHESCWGFFGDESYCIDEAKSLVDSLVKLELQKHQAKVKAWILNRVPLQARVALA